MVDPTIVKELILRNQGLNQIPEEISEMKNLEVLDLTQNGIVEINHTLDLNTSLKELNLSYNVGLSMVSASEEFFQLPTLKSIEMVGNGATYLNPNIGNLKSLERLNLANNALVFLPQTLSELPKLRYLNVADNNMQEIHLTFADLWNLEYLDISGNFQMSSYETFQNLQFKSKLKTLRCNLREISKTTAKALNTSGIEELIVTNSHLGKIHPTFSKNQTIKKITFENSYFTNPSSNYRRLNSIKNLDELTFVQTAIDPAIKDMNNVSTLNANNSAVAVNDVAKNKSITSFAIVDDEKDITSLIDLVKNKNSEIEVADNSIPVSQAMKNNTVEPIALVEPAVRKMDASKDVVLNFKDTECAIQKETFIGSDGEVYKGEVTIELTEYFDPVINALAGAPMTAQNPAGQDEIFASNGMINFVAKGENGEELKIDPLKPVEISIRNVQPQVQGALYSFDNTTNTWSNIGTPVATNLDSLKRAIYDSLSLIDDSQFASFTTFQPNFTLGITKRSRDAYSIHMNLPYLINYSRTKRTKNNLVVYNKREDIRMLAKKTWYLDTVVTNEMDSVFKSIGKMEKKIRKTTFRTYSSPRLLKEASLVPDFEHDNYRLNVTHQGVNYSWPVYYKENGNFKKVVSDQKKYFKKYDRKKMRHEKFMSSINEKRTKALVKAAEANRKVLAELYALQRVNGLSNSSSYNVGTIEMLRFGIVVNGFYNCDYFSRFKPSSWVNLPSTLRDQDGKKIDTPNKIRFIVVDENAYFELPSERVPVFKNKKSMIIMVISTVEIAVITAWEYVNNKLVPIVKRINVENKNPDEIRKEIYQP